jgi:hypothetical protein
LRVDTVPSGWRTTQYSGAEIEATNSSSGLPIRRMIALASSMESGSADLVARKVAVIFAGGPAARVAKAATKTIPIVYVSGEDPVNFGLVASLNRPGGNITGVNTFNAVLGSKRFELLGELVPSADVIAFLTNPISPVGRAETKETQAVARGHGRTIVLNASTESEIDAAFATLEQQRVGALVVTGDPFFVSRRDKIVALAARYAVPTIYTQRELSETPSSRQTTPSGGLLLLWRLFLLLLRLFHSDQRLLLVRAGGIFHRRNRVTDVDGDQQAFQHFDITRHPANFGLADTARFVGSRVLGPALDELFVRALLVVHAALVVL